MTVVICLCCSWCWRREWEEQSGRDKVRGPTVLGSKAVARSDFWEYLKALAKLETRCSSIGWRG